MTQQRLRWGILGTGNIAKQFAAGVGAAHRSVVAAVASRSTDSAHAFAKQFGIAAAYGSYDELLTNPAVDAVYVSLPNTLHHPWTIRALRAGKHVLCEKPLAASAAEAAEMFDVAQREGRLLVEAFMYRSHPLTHAVLDAIRAGEIGRVKLIRTSFCFRTNKLAGNIRFDPSLAGGSLMDVGCYCLNFTRLIAGAEPDRFEVYGHLNDSGVDDLAGGVLHFPNDVVATFQCGMLVQADNTATVSGEDGYIEIPVPWKPPRENAAYVVAHSTPPKMDGGTTTGPKPRDTRHVSAPTELYGLEADDVAASVYDAAPVRVTREDSLGNMRLLDAMRKQLGVRLP
jgi:xylose dehydrogenase (NAD/NADP)